MFLKSISIIKKNTSDLWLRPSPTMFREEFWPLMSFKEKIIHRHTDVLLRVDIMCCFVYDIANLLNRFRLPRRSPGRFFIYFLHWARDFAHTVFSPFSG